MSGGGDHIVAFLCVTWILLFLGCFYFTYKTADARSVPTFTKVVVTMNNFASVAILAIVPLDLSYTLVTRTYDIDSNRIEDFASHSRLLQRMYAAVYWVGLCLSTLVLPFLEEFNESGFVTLSNRLCDTMRRISLYVLVILVAFIGILILVIVTQGEKSAGQSISVSLITISNTINCIVLSALIGVGMAELPKSWYAASESEREINTAYAAVAVELANLKETTVALSTLFADAMCTLNAVQDNELKTALRNDCEHIKKQFGFRSSACGKTRMHTIGGLRRDLALARASHLAAVGSTEKIKARVFYLQDVREAMENPDRSIYWTLSNDQSSKYAWFYHCRLRPWLNRFVALVAAVGSACLATSQLGAMISGRPGLRTSAFAVMVRSAARSQPNPDAATAIAAVFCIAYLVLCSAHAFSLLKVRGYFELNFRKKTPPRILSFTCRTAGKLAPALLFNFLSTLHEVSRNHHPPPKVSDAKLRTAFDRFYSTKLDAITSGFDVIVAILILVFCFLHLANLLNRLLLCVKLGRYQFGAEIAAIDDDQLQEGKVRLDRDRKRLLDSARRDTKRDQLVAQKSMGIELADNTSRAMSDQARINPRRIEIKPPSTRTAWLTKQNPRAKIWKKRYFVLRPPGELVYFRKEIGVAPSGVIDLRLVIAVRDHEHDSLHLELPDRTLKIRADSTQSRDDWMKSIHAWREFAALQVHTVSSQQSLLTSIESDDSDDDTPGRFGTEPSTLDGDLRLKKPHSYRVDEWEPRYAQLNHDGFRLFTSRAANQAILTIDLRLVADISPHNKGIHSDPSRFNVDQYKFQALDTTTATRWMSALREWQDYLLLHHTSAASASLSSPSSDSTAPVFTPVVGENPASMV